jgi:hypothetical protein
VVIGDYFPLYWYVLSRKSGNMGEIRSNEMN